MHHSFSSLIKNWKVICNSFLLKLLFVICEFICQGLRHVTGLLIFYSQLFESTFEIGFYKVSLTLCITHLFSYIIDTLLYHLWINYTLLISILMTTITHLWMGQRLKLIIIALHHQQLFKFANLSTNSLRCSFRILIQQFHLIHLLCKWAHHLQHHSSIFIKNLLFETCSTVQAGGTLVHDVVDDL